MSYESFCESPARLERWVESAYSRAEITPPEGESPERPGFESRSRPSEFDEQIRRALDEAHSRLDVD